jgi:hypothetical protein
MKRLEIHVNDPLIVKVSRLPIGIPWDKEDKQPTMDGNTLFLLSYEEVEEKKWGEKG